jgi:hypothetical protein
MLRAVNQLTDDVVHAHDAERTDELTCPSCERGVHVVREQYRGETFVMRHIRHDPTPSSRSSEACAAGGESSIHERRKAIALSKALLAFDCAGSDLDETFLGAYRPDATVTFAESHRRYGAGLAIEYQEQNKSKDRVAVTENYREEGYTTVWLWAEQFTSQGTGNEDVDLFGGEVYPVWPTAVPPLGEWSGVPIDGYRSDWLLEYISRERKAVVLATMPPEWHDQQARDQWRTDDWAARFRPGDVETDIEAVRQACATPRESLDVTLPPDLLDGFAQRRWDAEPWENIVSDELESERYIHDVARWTQDETPGRVETTDAWRVWFYRDPELRRTFETAHGRGYREYKGLHEDVYQAVQTLKRVIEYNTGGKQSPTVSRSSLFITACAHGNVEPEVAQAALRNAVEDGEIIEEDGRYRLE